MPFLPNHLRSRREKFFGDGPRLPLDREAKVRIMHLARALMRKTEKGKHYGELTGKFVDGVLHALLWLIHDGRSGQCNPAYETIADKAACARSTVWAAIKALEAAGLLSWVNRITRIRERDVDLFGRVIWVWRVVRTSNAYTFRDPKPAEPRGIASKSELRTGPQDEVKNYPEQPPLDPDSPLGRALAGYGKAAGFAM
jgi:hypothetical protein